MKLLKRVLLLALIVLLFAVERAMATSPRRGAGA